MFFLGFRLHFISLSISLQTFGRRAELDPLRRPKNQSRLMMQEALWRFLAYSMWINSSQLPPFFLLAWSIILRQFQWEGLREIWVELRQLRISIIKHYSARSPPLILHYILHQTKTSLSVRDISIQKWSSLLPLSYSPALVLPRYVSSQISFLA